MKVFRFAFLFSSAFFLVSLFSDCGGAKEEKDDSKIFRFNELGDVRSLDPAQAGSFENNWALNQLYNGLVEMDTDLEVQPCIARSWSQSDDGTDYTFRLRTDVVFQDNPQFPGGKGRRVVASDFQYSFDRLFDKRISNASTLVDIVALDGNGQPGIESPDDSTLTIHLRHPFKPFLGVLTMKYFSVVPKEVVAFYGDDFYRNPVGTGPFKLKFWKDNSNLVFEKNPLYFKFDEKGNRLPYLDLVSVTFIKDPESAFMEFTSGDIDMITGIDAINKEKTLDREGRLTGDLSKKFVLQSAPFLKTDYFGILIDENLDIVKNSPVRIKYLRQAINYAIDRENIVRYRRYNLGTPANGGFIPPGMHAYDPELLHGFSYNPVKAKQLLDLAGFPNGKGLKPITLSTTGTYQDIAEDVVHQLNEIGIPAVIEVLPPATFQSAVAENKLLFFRKSWICDYPDPENFMSIFYSKNYSPAGANYTHFHNTEFDRLYEKCLTEQNDSIRADLFFHMDQIIVDESPVIPLYYDRVVRLVQKNISGLQVDPTNSLNLERVKKN
ncbi:MAG: ABC transporter substrate-binding protein [Bacteroidetes bacterium]|nr:ABC transporter substrate-binding protein [Bacteroidota bacterium]